MADTVDDDTALIEALLASGEFVLIEDEETLREVLGL